MKKASRKIWSYLRFIPGTQEYRVFEKDASCFLKYFSSSKSISQLKSYPLTSAQPLSGLIAKYFLAPVTLPPCLLIIPISSHRVDDTRSVLSKRMNPQGTRYCMGFRHQTYSIDEENKLAKETECIFVFESEYLLPGFFRECLAVLLGRVGLTARACQRKKRTDLGKGCPG